MRRTTCLAAACLAAWLPLQASSQNALPEVRLHSHFPMQVLKQAASLSSPIVIDLDRDGLVETTAVAGSRIYFDHDGNGFAEQTAWAAADDGMLVIDLNRNGQIDNGAELFGNHTLLADGSRAANGFEALKPYDTNQNGLLDSGDRDWHLLRIWQDKNQNGAADAGELRTLADVGLAAVDLSYRQTPDARDAHGNLHAQTGSVRWADGSTGAAADVWFQTEPARRRYHGMPEHSEAVKALPEIKAFGHVYDLRDAMMRDSQLHKMVQDYVAAEAPAQAQLEALIYRWTGVEEVAPDSRGVHIDARQLAAVEALTGEAFLQLGKYSNPRKNAAAMLKQEFARFATYTAGQMALQTEYAGLAEEVDAYRGKDGSLTYDWNGAILHLYRLAQIKGTETAAKAARAHLDALTYSPTAAADYRNKLTGFFEIVWRQEPERFWEMAGVVGGFNGSDADDELHGDQHDNILLGRGGHDVLYGHQGKDILIGGSGDDRLAGGEGNDIYVVAKGHGRDTIRDYAADGGVDMLCMRGIRLAETVWRKSGRDLVLEGYAAGDAVKIESFFNGALYKIEHFVFDDHTIRHTDLAQFARRADGRIDVKAVLERRGREQRPAASASTHQPGKCGTLAER